MGSRRITPTAPVAAAVVSEPITEPTNTPWFQLLDWYTRGVRFARRPPKMIAEIGTPAGLLNSGEMHGQFSAGAVNLEFGCARVLFLPVFSSTSAMNSGPFTLAPFHSVASTGGFLSSFSHQTVLSALFRATLVKMVFLRVRSGWTFRWYPEQHRRNHFPD